MKTTLPDRGTREMREYLCLGRREITNLLGGTGICKRYDRAGILTHRIVVDIPLTGLEHLIKH